LQSLVAPPLIDQVWRILIGQGKVYENFCSLAFGGYLDRKDPIFANDDPNTNYSATLSYLSTYKDLIKPIDNIWPNYENEDYIKDYKNYAYVNLDSLKAFEIESKTYTLHFSNLHILRHFTNKFVI
jgi:hypothetical protein